MKKIINLAFLFFICAPSTGFAYNIYTSTFQDNFYELTQDFKGTHLMRLSGCSYPENPAAAVTKDAYKSLANWNDPKSSDPVFSVIWSKCSASLKYQGSRSYSNMFISSDLDGAIGLAKRRTNYFTNEIVAVDVYVVPPTAEPVTTPFLTFTPKTVPTSEYSSCRVGNAASFNHRSVLTHELGHGLGFMHTSDNRMAVMRSKDARTGYYCDSLADRTITTLHPDDMGALVDWYPSTSYESFRDLSPIAYVVDDPGDRNIRAVLPADNPNNTYCPGDTIPNAEFSVANRGTKKLTYTRKFWATPTIDLLNSYKSILWLHSNRVKAPGARDGIYQGKQNLYFNNADLPQGTDSWFVVLETNVDGAEDRIDNNKAALQVKLRRDSSCP